MAYRRRQGQGLGRDWKTTSFKEENNETSSSSSSPTSPSLVTKAIRASSSYKDSSLSSAYYPSLSSPVSPSPASPPVIKDSPTYQSSSSKQGFWGVLARKAKGIIDDNDGGGGGGIKSPRAPLSESTTSRAQYYQTTEAQSHRKTDNASIQKGLDAITSSLNYIGGTIGNAFEEGLTMVENRTADIIQETRKIQIKKKDRNFDVQNQNSNIYGSRQQLPVQTQPQTHADLEIQLKASRDVAMAMAAKAKLLLRELKTVKADLAFAKERCGQLEEENRVIRESSAKGGSPEDDDLIRLQLETLLAEKARLAQENSVFARENRFLREIVEYHQLTMQDVVYLDENNEEVTEVYPIKVPPALLQSSSTTAISLPSPTPPPAAQFPTSPHSSREASPFQVPP